MYITAALDPRTKIQMGPMSQKLEISKRDSPHHQDPSHPGDLGGVVRAKTAKILHLWQCILARYARYI